MCGPLSHARGQFSLIKTSSGFFWSLALACGPFSQRVDLFIACVAHVNSILSNVRTFFVLANRVYYMCGPLSLACGPFSIIGTPSGLFWSLALACGPFSPQMDLFLLPGSTRGQFSIKRTDLCPPHADLFRSRGPFICYV
jgi:hypothetical protein